MNLHFHTKLVFVFSLVLCSFITFGQKLEIGTSIGVCQYKGDVMPSYRIFMARPGGGVFVRYNLSRAVSVKAQGIIGVLRGNDTHLRNEPLHTARQYSFTNVFKDFGVQVEYNFLNFRTNQSRIISNWTPYILAGGGINYSQINAKYWSFNPSSPFNSFSTKSNPNYLSLGVGFKKQWKQQWNWGVEFGTRWTNTDFLDGLGYYSDGSYAVTSSATTGFVSPYLRQKFSVPGTLSKDIYYYTNFSISYLFYKVHCPKR